ncbi:unnamed protein product [Cochlearia groenlandica]
MQIQILCFVTLFLQIFISKTTLSYKINLNHFGNVSDLFSLHGDAEPGLNRSGSISLTRGENPFSYGRAVFKEPINFKRNASSLYPFKTSFTFSITTTTKPNQGHGLAFFIVPINQTDTVSGLGYLGLVNRNSNGNPQNHLFAVEFDVFRDRSLQDINDNHVGIDVNSVNSVYSVKSGYWVMTRNGWLFKDLDLCSGDKYKAWIEYNDNYNTISVTIGLFGLKKPNRPLIEEKLDLSKVLLERMYTGFSGSMGRGVERHQIWDWSFQN